MRKEIEYDGTLIAEIIKNDKAKLMIGIKEFHGRAFIDMREWVDDSDYLGPTKKGVTLTVGKFEDLRSAIEQLEKQLKGEGENNNGNDIRV